MKRFTILLFAGLIGLTAQAQHQLWLQLLQKHVHPGTGMVNYQGFQRDSARLNQYLEQLASYDVAQKSPAAQKAFWMNVYNAYTVALIVKHYPLKSIRDIEVSGKGPWDIPLVRVGGKNYTLNQVEHEILRPEFQDPRIHAGINCASFSCPKLLPVAFTEANVEAQLDQAFRQFIHDPERNTFSPEQLELSRLFKWFSEDFTQQGSLINFLSRWYDGPIAKDASISYREYDWSLNEYIP